VNTASSSARAPPNRSTLRRQSWPRGGKCGNPADARWTHDPLPTPRHLTRTPTWAGLSSGS